MVGLAVSRRAGEAPPVKRAAQWTAALVVGQLILGAAMVLAVFPVWLRILHQAAGIGVWLAMFLSAYVARQAALRTLPA
jgi:heme A synthase